MLLKEKLRLCIKAAQASICISTDEVEDAVAEIKAAVREWEAAGKTVVLKTWDRVAGLRDINPEKTMEPKDALVTATNALRNLLTEGAYYYGPEVTKDMEPTPVILLISNVHLAVEKDLENWVTLLQQLSTAGKQMGKFVVLIKNPNVPLPRDLASFFYTIEHELPTVDELTAIFTACTPEQIQEKYENEIRQAAIAAKGLTRIQAEGIYAHSLVESGQVIPKNIWTEKLKLINQEGLVEIHESPFNFDDIGGLDGIKDFLQKLCRVNPLCKYEPEARAKGVVVVGPPGTGKSMLAYCLGNATGMVTVKIDPGKLKNQYVGNTEERTRRMFSLLKTMAPCIAVVDEVEKVMPRTDDQETSQIGRQMLGTFLTQMNDMVEPVFWFFTSNDVRKLPSALFRAERIDAKVLVGLPDAAARAKIWRTYIKKFYPTCGDPQVDMYALPIDIMLDEISNLRTFITTPEAIAAVLMTVTKEEREEILHKYTSVDKTLVQAIRRNLVDDTNWTPAEIKQCCRLSRLLDVSIAEAARSIGHECTSESGKQHVSDLKEWAVEVGALDAQTATIVVSEKETARNKRRRIDVGGNN